MTERPKKTIPILDFFRAFCQQQAAHCVPVTNYASMLDQELIIWLVLFRAWVREVVWKLMDLDNTGITADDAEKSKGTLYRMLIPGTPDQLCALVLLRAKSRPTVDLTPIIFIVWANVQLALIISEIEARLAKRKIGKKIMEMIFHGSEFPHKFVVDEVRHEARRWRRGGDLLIPHDRAQEVKDREQDVLAACISFQKRMEGMPHLLPEGDFFLPPLPRLANLPRERSEALTRLNNRFASDDLKAFWRDILPCLQGQAEKIPGKAYQAIRTDDDKRKAQKRTGEIVQMEDSHARTEAPLTYGMLYRRFESRWGERGITFLKALAEGDTVTEASRKAGITRQTGHKYKKELEKEVSLTRKSSKK